MDTLLSPTLTRANKTHRCEFCLGEIEKGTKYLKSKYVDGGDIWTWKTHESCANIATELGMYDMADDGLTQELFVECINETYNHIMSETQNELYESKDFVIPKFNERLAFVIAHHEKAPTQSDESKSLTSPLGD
jgi:hypothetical protein